MAKRGVMGNGALRLLLQSGLFARLSLIASAVVFAACAASPSAAETDARKIIAVGDLHGDYDAYMEILTDAGLVDRRGRWSGDDAVFVQLGDAPDRGPDTRKIIDHLRKLETQAERKGGEVVALIGNHEAMNVTGDLRYVTPEEYAAFKDARSRRLRSAFFDANKEAFSTFYRKDDPALSDADVESAFEADYPLGYIEHRRAWAPTGDIGAWVVGHDVVRIVNRTLFVHGGMSLDYVGKSVDEINAEAQAALAAENAEAEILYSETSPLWYRGNVKETEEGAAEIDAVLAAFDVDRIVVGHTPQLKGVTTFYDGKVVAIDTGISDYYGGVQSYLKIIGDRVTAVNNGEDAGL